MNRINLNHFLFCFLFLGFLICNFEAHCEERQIKSTDRLANLCKVWGAMKYFHPKIQKGEVDWDRVLTEAIPTVLASKNNEEYNLVISRLFKDLGSVKQLSSPRKNFPKDSSVSNLNFTWTNDGVLDSQNALFVNSIVDNYVPRKNVYIKNEIGKYYGERGQEIYYNKDSNAPDSIQALVDLFKYWNAIQYFYSYKKLLDYSWDSVLSEFIPRMLTTANSNQFFNEMARLVSKIQDCHSFFENYYFNTTVSPVKSLIEWRPTPFRIKFINGESVITGISDSLKLLSGLDKGDILKSVNGIEMDSIRNEFRQYCGCSTKYTIERDVDFAILMSYHFKKDSIINVGYLDKTGTYQEASFVNRKYERSKPAVYEDVRKLNDSIGYIDLDYLTVKEIRKGINSLGSTKYLIFDLRRNANAPLLPIGMRLPNRRHQRFAKFYDGNVKFPGTYKLTYSKDAYLGLRLFHKKYKGKVIFLINENVQSTYEYQLMSLLADYDVTLIGSNTAGTDGQAASFYIQPNILTYFSFSAVLWPNGRQTQRIGIPPNIYVQPTIEDIRGGNDTVLNRALKFISDGN